jgi:ABC-type multidrug transport system ATPase subunit
MPGCTVAEALRFAAEMRLDPAAVSPSQKAAFVADITGVLELHGIADRRVETLGRGELKRLSIGVEMAGNPPILFLDEPTTGLDARSAALVVNVLKRVAASGRTIICTIHQPSAAVFFAFDSLLLLAPGGHQVYFGPTGAHAACVSSFLEGIPSMTPLAPGVNPAEWMMQSLENLKASAAAVVATEADEEAGKGGVEGGGAVSAERAAAVAARQAGAARAAAARGLPTRPRAAEHVAAY